MIEKVKSESLFTNYTSILSLNPQKSCVLAAFEASLMFLCTVSSAWPLVLAFWPAIVDNNPACVGSSTFTWWLCLTELIHESGLLHWYSQSFGLKAVKTVQGSQKPPLLFCYYPCLRHYKENKQPSVFIYSFSLAFSKSCSSPLFLPLFPSSTLLHFTPSNSHHFSLR